VTIGIFKGGLGLAQEIRLAGDRLTQGLARGVAERRAGFSQEIGLGRDGLAHFLSAGIPQLGAGLPQKVGLRGLGLRGFEGLVGGVGGHRCNEGDQHQAAHGETGFHGKFRDQQSNDSRRSVSDAQGTGDSLPGFQPDCQPRPSEAILRVLPSDAIRSRLSIDQ
jgi:hypothetical protein